MNVGSPTFFFAVLLDDTSTCKAFVSSEHFPIKLRMSAMCGGSNCMQVPALQAAQKQNSPFVSHPFARIQFNFLGDAPCVSLFSHLGASDLSLANGHFKRLT